MSTPGNRVSSSTRPSDASRANSLGIDQKTLEQVVRKLDQAAPKDSKPKRGFVRWPYPLANLELLIDNTGGGATSVRVAARNLSCGGVGILHRSYLHPKTKVRVRLKSTSRGMVEIPGVICRCSFKGGVVHDIGIRFDKLIDIHDFATNDLLDERFTLETLQAEDLIGQVLYIEDSAMDIRLAKHYLRLTKVALTIVGSAKEAMASLNREFSVIMCDYHLPDGDAPEIIKQLKEAGVKAPIIAVTSDGAKVPRDRLRAAGVSAFLAKPLTEDRLHRALGEFLLAERWSEKTDPMSSLDDESAGVVDTAFREELAAGRDLLQKLMCEEHVVDAQAVCGRIAITAKNLRMNDLASRAALTKKELSARQSCADCREMVDSLLEAITSSLKQAA